MKSIWLVSMASAILFTAVSAGALPPPEPEPAAASAERSTGFFAMDHADHRDWTFDIGGGAMYLKLDGRLGFETSLGDIRFRVDALDLDREWQGWVRAEVKIKKKHRLRFNFLPVDFDGDKSIEVGLPIDDPIFDVNDRVKSDAKLYTYQLTYLYDFNLGKYVTISPSITLGLIDANIEVRDKTLDIGWDFQQLVPLPEIGLRVEVFPCARLSIFGEAKGFTIGDKATEWDASGGIKLFVNRHFYVEGSYRAIDYDIDWFDTIIDTTFHGPFIGGVLRF